MTDTNCYYNQHSPGGALAPKRLQPGDDIAFTTHTHTQKVTDLTFPSTTNSNEIRPSSPKTIYTSWPVSNMEIYTYTEHQCQR